MSTMSSVELNKWIGAFLATALFVMVLKIFGDALFPAHHNHSAPVFLVESGIVTEHSAQAQTSETVSLPSLLLAADQAAGKKTARKCLACHTFELDGVNKIGPNLWDIAGSAKAARSGFSYSSSLTDIGGTWDYDALNSFLTSPKTYAPGTKMAFPGIKKPTARANVIVYLRALSDTPIALPTE
ncbi:MAG: cytochrome c family protein [Alphaproteobacteria bacterium]